jgi:hypothetical protein
MKHIKHEATTEQLKFFMGAGMGYMARYDMAVGDPGKCSGNYFQRAGLAGLSVADIHARTAWLRACNSSGGGVTDHALSIYISPSVSGGQHLLMMDDLSMETCRQIGEGRLHLIVETSANNHQLWLPTSRPVTVEERHQCQVALQKMFGGDDGSVSGDHLGRLSGFKNTKHDNAWVNLVGGDMDFDGNGRRCDVDSLIHHFQSVCLPLTFSTPRGFCDSGSAQPCVSPSLPPSGGGGGVSVALGRDESKMEFGWSVGWLKSKKDEAEGIRKLAERALARGKHKTFGACEKYARRTFDRARAVA